MRADDHVGATPAAGARLAQPVDEGDKAAAAEDHAEHVEPYPRTPCALGDHGEGSDQHGAAMGRLTYRHQRQSTYWVRKPPRMSPNAEPPMAIVA